jgi:hypothetical protein
MALKSGFPGYDQGGGVIYTQANTFRRTYRVGEPDDFVDYEETSFSYTAVWPGLTEAACRAHIALNEQPTNGTASWSYTREGLTQAYTLQLAFNTTSTRVLP